MVHLATVRSDKERKASSVIPGLEMKREPDTANTTVYGSSYAGQVRDARMNETGSIPY